MAETTMNENNPEKPFLMNPRYKPTSVELQSCGHVEIPLDFEHGVDRITWVVRKEKMDEDNPKNYLDWESSEDNPMNYTEF